MLNRIDDRATTRIAARLIVQEDTPLPVLVTNLSRGGCRVEPTPVLPAAAAIRIEVDGWPRLTGRVVWSEGRRTGCIFDPRPTEAVYDLMLGRLTRDAPDHG